MVFHAQHKAKVLAFSGTTSPLEGHAESGNIAR